MKVVFDTNVVVSGFLNPQGAPGALVRLAAQGRLIVCYDARILAEYREVLLRPKFGLTPGLVDPFLDQVQSEGYRASPRPLSHRLPDPDDEPFLEVAASCAAPLVTGNLRHYPAAARASVRVESPADYLERWRRGAR